MTSSALTNEKKYSLVKACVDAFNSACVRHMSYWHTLTGIAVNVILVVGHEKLNVEMQRMFGQDLTVVKIPKSGGVRNIHVLQNDLQLFTLRYYDFLGR